MGLVDKIRKVTATGLVGLLLTCPTLKAESLNLKLNSSFVGSDYTQGSFNARLDTENGSISNSYDANDVLQQPNLTDLNFIQSYTINTGYPLTEDYKVFDPNQTYWDIRLMAEDYNLMQGFTGTARVSIDDPNTITNFPSEYDVILYRYDKDEVFQEEYNLRDPNNYTIDWAVTNALSNYSTLQLWTGYQTNDWDLNDDGTVNLQDFSIFANGWQTTYDTTDLASFCENWLWTRGGGMN